jgi:UDP-N-acetylmuramate: L-alanyl-gamma-D-glutamyl-meso-diaminopimelate ligase
VIDDFAHHPTAVRETIDAVRQRYPRRPLVAVFEPRSYTAQRKEFEQPYTEALACADRIILAGLFRPERYTKETGLDPAALIGGLQQRGRTAAYIPVVDDIVADLAGSLGHEEVVVIMSNGGFGGIHVKLLDALQRP